ncbi:hypothetical protein M758_10G027200 [Ceratodon purpureus]|nr:hypothetical protein M758_10G027200 [Ceratodon purpureus]
MLIFVVGLKHCLSATFSFMMTAFGPTFGPFPTVIQVLPKYICCGVLLNRPGFVTFQ